MRRRQKWRGITLRNRLQKLNRSKSSRKLRQPSLYSRTEGVGKKRSFKGILLLFLGFLLFGLIVYLVFLSGVFAVETVEIASTRYVSRGDLTRAVEDNRTFLDSNIITYGIFDLAGRVEEVTGVERVTISRASQHKIALKIEEKTPLLVWQSAGKSYLVDDLGYVWGDYSASYASSPVLIDTKNLPVKKGDKLLPQGSIDFFKELKASFPETGAKIIKYEIMDIVSDLKVVSDAGWYVYFDTNRSARGELVSLKRVLTEAKNTGTKLEYVDLRIANRIFYK